MTRFDKMSVLVLVLLSFCFIASESFGGEMITKIQAENLIRNMPDYLKSKANRGCPEIDQYSYLDHKTILFQLRNKCPSSGTGLIGNYVINLEECKIWLGIDRNEIVDSPRLRELRKAYLKEIKSGAKCKGKAK